jgi:hypothetical protein
MIIIQRIFATHPQSRVPELAMQIADPARHNQVYFPTMSLPTERLVKNSYVKFRFDFDIGYLVKSPCKACQDRDAFPRCIDACDILERIHTVMAESISCARRR